MEQYATRAQEIKSFAVASLVERAVGALDMAASRLDDQCEGSHAATADATEKVISSLGHQRNLPADKGRVTVHAGYQRTNAM
jgi:hypothetical protein